MKKLLIIAIAAFAFTACGDSAKTETTATDSPKVEASATPEAAAPVMTHEDSVKAGLITETAPVAPVEGAEASKDPKAGN